MNVPDNERQLLFALLAFQNNFIDRAALLAGFDTWAQDKSKSLAAVFLEREVLNADERSLVEALVDRHLARNGRDVHKSLAHISSLNSSLRDELDRLVGPDLQASLAAVGRGVDPFATAPLAAGTETSLGSRFRILRPHARGGLGEVFVAADEELPREVALKQIQPRHADHHESRARFLQEAEITGALEHPSIVPVYGLGTYADGRPFYAMRFIRGDSLQDAIKEYYESKSRDAEVHSLQFRKLLQRFIDVCEAIEYAHSRGVLHRDLKPGNIMLGKYGETLVVDWGLAKVAGRSESVGGAPPTERAINRTISDGSAPTEFGVAIGTPAYMSPEQADGRVDIMGPTTDVYGLGATFYHLLTGKPPIAGDDLGDMLRRVRTGTISAPRSVRPDVSPALEAICLKAMALRQEDRYATPRKLADDVENWLADEPISAYREGFLTRVGRWTRKHRVAVVGLGVLMATAVVALAIGIGAVSVEQRETARQRDAAESQRLLALKNQALAEVARAKENEQRLTAERLRTAADEQREIADRTAYLANIQAADFAWVAGQAAMSKMHLDRTPPERRGWEFDYLQARLRRGQSIRPHTTANLFAPVVNSKRDRVALSFGRVVQIWDGELQKLLYSLEGHSNTVYTAAFHPDGDILATGGQDRTIRLWDVRRGESLGVVNTFSNQINAICFGADGKLFAAGGNVPIWIYDLKEKTGSSLDPNRRLLCNALAIDPNQEFLLCGGFDSLQSYRFADRKWSVLKGIEPPLTCVAISPNGKQLAAVNKFGKLTVWNVDGTSLASVRAHEGAVYSLGFDASGTRILTSGHDNLIRVWRSADLMPLKILRGHHEYAYSSFLGENIVSAGHDATLRIWQPAECDDPKVLLASIVATRQTHFDAEEKKVIVGDHGGFVHILDRFTGVNISKTLLALGVVNGIVPGTEKQTYFIFGNSGAVLFDASGRMPIRKFDNLNVPVYFAAISRDGEYLATSSIKSMVLRGLKSGAIMHQTETRGPVAFDSKNRLLYSERGDLVAYDPVGGRELARVHLKSKAVESIATLRNGSRIAFGTVDGLVGYWSCDGSSPVMMQGGHTGAVNSIAESPDSKRIATAGLDRLIRIWNLATGEETLVLRGHDAEVTSVEFSSDGKQLLSSGMDGKVLIWDAAQTGLVKTSAPNPVNRRILK